jgi:hypothetical protein
MTIIDQISAIDPQVRADMEAVMRQWLEGIPLDVEISRRIDERARLITEEVRRVHGDNIDVDQLIRDARDEA